MIVLKIVGIALLVLLVLVPGILLLLLLVPIRYSLSGAYDGTAKGKGALTWLFHAVSVTVTYDERPDVAVRILGKLLGGRKKPAKADEREDSLENRQPGTEAKEPQGDDTREKEEDDFLTQQPEDGELLFEEEREEAEAEDKKRSPWKGKKGPKRGKKKEKEPGDSPTLREKLESAVDSIREQWTRLREKKETIETFLSDKENQKTIRLLLKQTKALICHILPRKVRGNLTLGFEDPSVTGNALAVLSILYVWYGDSIKVTPVFDEAVIRMDGTIKGRLCLGTILVLVIRVLLNKNFRLLVRRWRGKRGKINGRQQNRRKRSVLVGSGSSV